MMVYDDGMGMNGMDGNWFAEVDISFSVAAS
jgi:hypothetical protein